MRLLGTLSVLLLAAQAAAWNEPINFFIEPNTYNSGTQIRYYLDKWGDAQGVEITTPGVTTFTEISAPVTAAVSIGGTTPVSAFGYSFTGTKIFTSIPTITAQNLDTGASADATGFFLRSYTSNGTLYQTVGFTFGEGMAATTGQHVRISGVSGGLFSISQSYMFFNQGYWLVSGQTMVQTASPLPEPSTYGLALGGLVLVGAVIRRRRKA